MKYLDIPELSALTSFLASLELGDRQLKANIDAYSCKQAGEDKRLGKQLEQMYVQEIEQSPSAALGSSPLGTFSDPHTRKLLINLICTLNSSYPDYDFSNLKPEQFMKENLSLVMNHVNTTFAEIVETHSKSFLEDLWNAIDRVIQLKDSQVFSYIPDYDNDPFSIPATLWSFNYFFYNKTEKKIVFFACSCTSKKPLEQMISEESFMSKEEEIFVEENSEDEWESSCNMQESDGDEEILERAVVQ